MFLRVGDIVTLNGYSSPALVVCEVENSEHKPKNRAICVWFTPEGVLKREVFDARTLTLTVGEKTNG